MKISAPNVLLFIEPTGQKKYHRGMAKRYKFLGAALVHARRGVYNVNGSFKIGAMTMGHHTCACGERGGSQDVLLNGNFVTNALAYHYVCYHWDELPAEERQKLDILLAMSTLKVFRDDNEPPPDRT